MIESNEFDELVSRSFSWLLDLGFVKDAAEKGGYTMIYVPYRKNDLVARIGYALRHDYIEACIAKNPQRPQDFGSHESSVLLFHLMSKYKPDYNYERDYLKIMPKEIGMTKSVEAVSKLFNQYAIDILSGKKWESWGDITGWNPGGPHESKVYWKGKLVYHKITISNEQRSLEALESDIWPSLSDHPTLLVKTVYLLRKKPLRDLEPDDLRLLISQNIGLKHLIPIAIDLLSSNPLRETRHYPGDLLAATLAINPKYWAQNPIDKRRFDLLLQRSLPAVAESVLFSEDIRSQLSTAIQSYFSQTLTSN